MIAQEHQTIIDLAIQSCGSAEAAFEFALLNGFSVTDDIMTGRDLSLPGIVDVDVLNYFTQKGICPATAVGVIPDLIPDALVETWHAASLQTDELIVLDGQNFIDLATFYCGTPELAADFALLNGLSVTDILEAGTKLKKPAVANKKVQAYFAQKNIHPATDIDITSNTGGAVELAGIGYWTIEVDFIIS